MQNYVQNGIIYTYIGNDGQLYHIDRDSSEIYPYQNSIGIELFMGKQTQYHIHNHRKKSGSIISKMESESFFFFHALHAFENANGEIIIDIPAYPDDNIMKQFFIEKLMSQHALPLSSSKLRRYKILKKEHPIFRK